MLNLELSTCAVSGSIDRAAGSTYLAHTIGTAQVHFVWENAQFNREAKP